MFQLPANAANSDHIMTIVGTIVTVASFVLALVAEIRRRSARKAANLAEERLFTYIAGNDFALAARTAYDLVFVVRARDWNSAHSVTASLAKSVAYAQGKWSKKLKRPEVDALNTLQGELVEWIGLIPKDDAAPNSERTDLIVKGCISAIQTIEPISARLGREILRRNGGE